MFKRLKETAFERRSRRNKHDIIRTWINFSAGKLKACSRLRIAVKKPEWSFSDKIPGKIDPALAAEQHLDIRTGKRLQLRRIFYDFCHKKLPFKKSQIFRFAINGVTTASQLNTTCQNIFPLKKKHFDFTVYFYTCMKFMISQKINGRVRCRYPRESNLSPV